MCGAKHDAPVWQKVATRGAAHARRDQFVRVCLSCRSGFGIHYVNLITSLVVDFTPVTLKHKMGIIKTPVRFGVVTTEGELANVAKM